MSQELINKVIQAGLVPAQALRLVQMWRTMNVPVDLSLEERTEGQLMNLVREIAELLEEDELPEIRETMPGIDRQFEIHARTAVFQYDTHLGPHLTFLRAMRDSMGWLLVPQGTGADREAVRVGTFVCWEDKWHTIVSAMPMYTGSEVRFMKCELRSVSNAEVPNLPNVREK